MPDRIVRVGQRDPWAQLKKGGQGRVRIRQVKAQTVAPLALPGWTRWCAEITEIVRSFFDERNLGCEH